MCRGRSWALGKMRHKIRNEAWMKSFSYPCSPLKCGWGSGASHAWCVIMYECVQRLLYAWTSIYDEICLPGHGRHRIILGNHGCGGRMHPACGERAATSCHVCYGGAVVTVLVATLQILLVRRRVEHNSAGMNMSTQKLGVRKTG